MQFPQNISNILTVKRKISNVRKKIKIVNVQDLGMCPPSFRSLESSSTCAFKLPQPSAKSPNNCQNSHYNLAAQKKNHKANFESVLRGKVTKSKSKHSVYVRPSALDIDKENDQNRPNVYQQPVHHPILENSASVNPNSRAISLRDQELKQQHIYAQRKIHLNHYGRPVKASLLIASERDQKNLRQMNHQYKVDVNKSGTLIKNSLAPKNDSIVGNQIFRTPTNEKQAMSDTEPPRPNPVYVARRGRPPKKNKVDVSQFEGTAGQNISKVPTFPRSNKTWPNYNQQPFEKEGSTFSIESVKSSITDPSVQQDNIQRLNVSSLEDINVTNNEDFISEKYNLQVVDDNQYKSKDNHDGAPENYLYTNASQIVGEETEMTDGDGDSSHQRVYEFSENQETITENTQNLQPSENDPNKMTQNNINKKASSTYYNDSFTQESQEMIWVSMHNNNNEDIFFDADEDYDHDGIVDDFNLSHSNDVNNQQFNNFKDIQIDSNKIVDLNNFFNEIHEKFDVHGKNDCEGLLRNIRMVKFINQGLRTHIEFQCIECGHKEKIWTSPKEPSVGLQLNTAAVAGSLTSGIGYSTLREILSSMNIRCMAEPTYIAHRDAITKIINTMSTAEMNKAKLEEIRLAIEAGDVTEDGVPFITVIIDGAWSKRSYYRSKYDALSGVAIIIGVRTGKVLFCGVRNKACSFCDRAERENRPPTEHICYKNWEKDKPSSGMETDIIAEGFMESVNNKDPKYNVIYRKIIADGDSSVYNTILTLDPYKKHGILIQKIECSNHLYRNFCKNMYDASKLGMPYPPTECFVGYLRERINKSGYEMRKYVERAVEKWKNTECTFTEKTTGLRDDIMTRMVRHTFGDHSQCAHDDDECKEHAKKFKGNHMAVLQANYEINSKINSAVRRLYDHADSLLQSLTNNPAELCNSILCKEVGGKRINYCCRNSYYLRALCAAVQFSDQDVLSKIMLYSGSKIPAVITELEKNRQERNLRVHKYRMENRGRNRWSATGLDNNYGPLSYLNKKADMLPAEFDEEKKRIINELKNDQKDRLQIEIQTRDQSLSELWRAKRRRLITASHFGSICTKKPSTKRAPEVKSIRATNFKDSPAMRFGREHEAVALELLESKINQKIDKCGLVIDEEYEMLACSPDGFIEKENAIVEVKSLYKGRALTPTEAIKSVDIYKGIFKNKNNPTEMKESHRYYYQVQGQLHITKSSFCYFVVYTEKGTNSDDKGGIHYIKVKPDLKFWDEKMKPKLLLFWEHALLPEIVDPRLIRGMEVREPNSAMTAIQGVAKKKQGTIKDLKRKKKNNQVVNSTDDDSDRECQSDEQDVAIDMSTDTVLFKTNTSTGNNESNTAIEFDADHEDMVELVIRNINEEDAINNILTKDSLLNDDAIQLYTNILEASIPDIVPARVLHMSYQHLIRPSAMDRDIAIIGGRGSAHWCCIYHENDTIKIYDSGARIHYDQLANDEKSYLNKRYPSVGIKNIKFMTMRTHQPDTYSCGVYAAAFATALALGDDPETILYSQNVIEMRQHMSTIIIEKALFAFPQE